MKKISSPGHYWINTASKIQIGYGYSMDLADWKYDAYGRKEYLKGSPFEENEYIIEVVEKTMYNIILEENAKLRAKILAIEGKSE